MIFYYLKPLIKFGVVGKLTIMNEGRPFLTRFIPQAEKLFINHNLTVWHKKIVEAVLESPGQCVSIKSLGQALPMLNKRIMRMVTSRKDFDPCILREVCNMYVIILKQKQFTGSI